MAQGWLAGALAGLLALPAGCDLPRDPHGTRNAVRGGTLVAALVAPELTPAEAAALDALARALDADLRLVPGDLHAALGALDRGEVQLVVGGVPAATPLGHEAALSKPVGRERLVLMVRRGENALLLAANRAVAEAERERRGDAGAGPPP